MQEYNVVAVRLESAVCWRLLFKWFVANNTKLRCVGVITRGLTQTFQAIGAYNIKQPGFNNVKQRGGMAYGQVSSRVGYLGFHLRWIPRSFLILAVCLHRG